MPGALMTISAVVATAPPSADLEKLLAGYAALTAQFGGQFATLQGPPATALAGFARQHKVTEMVLARTAGGHAGRHPTARELARRAGDAEVHVLPVQAIFAARSDG